MKLNEEILKILSKAYEPLSTIDTIYKGKELTIQTDREGNPILLFIGRRLDSGKIKGERYVRTLKKDSQGLIFKDHWELKGKAS